MSPSGQPLSAMSGFDYANRLWVFFFLRPVLVISPVVTITASSVHSTPSNYQSAKWSSRAPTNLFLSPVQSEMLFCQETDWLQNLYKNYSRLPHRLVTSSSTLSTASLAFESELRLSYRSKLCWRHWWRVYAAATATLLPPRHSNNSRAAYMHAILPQQYTSFNLVLLMNWSRT